MKYVDLHLHTVYSDGMDTPEQIIKYAKINRLDAIAITDHDTLDGIPVGAKEAKKWGIKLITGVEISTEDYHLLGLDFDPENKQFAEFIKHSQDIQKNVTKQRVGILQDYGVPIKMDMIESEFPYSTLGKYTIFMTIFSDEKCRNYLREKHKDVKPIELFRYYLGSEGIAGDVEKKGVIYWDQAIKEVHKAGGMAVFAHPSKKNKHPSEIEGLLNNGIDGIEVQPFFKEKNDPFVEYAKQNNLLITYGSDHHGFIFPNRILGRANNLMDNLKK